MAIARRLYKMVGIERTAVGFALLLDGKPAKTPGRMALELPTEALAQAIAREWEDQGEHIDPATMPMTRLASIALDLVAPRANEVVEGITKYAGTDLVCYRATEPPELVRQQRETWNPLLDWLDARFGAPLAAISGIVPRAQPEASLRAIAAAAAARSAWELAALHLATAALGSVVLALALAEGRIDADAAFAASVLDESFEIERWGEDVEQMRRRSALRDDVAAAARFLALLRG